MPGFKWKAELDTSSAIQGINKISSSATNAVNALNSMAGRSAKFASPVSSLNNMGKSISSIGEGGKRAGSGISGMLGQTKSWTEMLAKGFTYLGSIEGGVKAINAGLQLSNGQIIEFDTTMRSLPLGIGPVYGAVSDVLNTITGWKDQVQAFDELIKAFPDLEIKADLKIKGIQDSIKEMEREIISSGLSGARKTLSDLIYGGKDEIKKAKEEFKKSIKEEMDFINKANEQVRKGTIFGGKLNDTVRARDKMIEKVNQMTKDFEEKIVQMRKLRNDKIRIAENELQNERLEIVKTRIKREKALEESKNKLIEEAKKRSNKKIDLTNRTEIMKLKLAEKLAKDEKSKIEIRYEQSMFDAKIKYAKALRESKTEEEKKFAKDRFEIEKKFAELSKKEEKDKLVDSLKLAQGKWFEFAKAIDEKLRGGMGAKAKMGQGIKPGDFEEGTIFIDDQGKWQMMTGQGKFKDVNKQFKEKILKGGKGVMGRDVREEFKGKFIERGTLKQLDMEGAIKKTQQLMAAEQNKELVQANKILEKIEKNTSNMSAKYA